MPRTDKKGRSKHDPKHVRLDWWLMEAYAYRRLSPPARALLVEFKFLYNGMNNGELFMSQRDAARALGLKTHTTAAKYLRELETWGFIKVRLKGSFGNKVGLASAYTLTEYPFGHRPATKDFLKRKPSREENRRMEEIYPAWIKNGRRGAKYLPDHWPDGVEFSARAEDFATDDGADSSTTCNIPGGRVQTSA